MYWANSGITPIFLILLVVVFIIILHSVAGGNRRPGEDGRSTRRPAPFGEDLSGDPRQDASFRDHSSKDVWLCERRECQALNPPRARFCRMCGRTRL